MIKTVKRFGLIFLLAALIASVALLAVTKQNVAAQTNEKTFVLSHCDDASDFTNISTVNHNSYITGSGSILSVSPLGTINAVFSKLDYTTLPAFDDAYLEMFLYIGDVENIALDGGAIELTSSGINDIDEISFPFTPTKIGLKTGWNYISLKLSDFANGGGFEYSKIRAMRIFAFPVDNSKLLEVGVDEIIVTDTPRIEQVKQDGIQVKGDKYPTLEDKVMDNVLQQVYDNSGVSALGITLCCVFGALALGAGVYIVFLLVKKPFKAKGKGGNE